MPAKRPVEPAIKPKSTMNQDQTVAAPVAKTVSAWIAVGISSWQDVASILAAFYTFLLVFEWFWSKFWRPLLERNGYLQPRKRKRKDDDSVDSKTAPLF